MSDDRREVDLDFPSSERPRESSQYDRYDELLARKRPGRRREAVAEPDDGTRNDQPARGIYKREGTDRWWLRYRDADGKLVRRSSGTVDKKLAEARLTAAEAGVAATKQARLVEAATGAGQKAPAVVPLAERVRRLEGVVRRLVRLHATEAELLREWLEAEGDHGRTE